MSIAIKHILVPTDFSEGSDGAFTTAVEIARAFDARITLMHAWAIPPIVYAQGVSWPMTEFREAARLALEERYARAAAVYPSTQPLLREGSDWVEITRATDELHADLVVMGTRGRRGITRLLLGSVAEKVVRLSNVPVVTVGQARAPGAHAGFRRIVVPVDFSECSELALALAIDMARTFHARLTLLHVWSLPYTGYTAALSWPIEEVEASARSALAKLLERTKAAYHETDATLRNGLEASEIVAFSEEENADLVVMGTHGRTGLPRLFLGSVATAVVRLSPVPVLTYRQRTSDSH